MLSLPNDKVGDHDKVGNTAGVEAHQLRDRGQAQGGGEPAPTPQDRHCRP